MRAALAQSGIAACSASANSRGPAPGEPEETGEGFLANAGIKALHYQGVTGLPALAEDSGLEVDALDGGPGVRSARWLGRETPYAEKNRHLLELLAASPARGRGARYRSAVAVAVAGRILFRSTGDGGRNDCGRPPRQWRLWLRPGVSGSGIRQDDGGAEPRGKGAHHSSWPGASAGRPFPEGGPRRAGTYNPLASRGVAQSGSAPALGAGSRRFKSSRPDKPGRRGRGERSRPARYPSAGAPVAQ